MEAVMSRMSAVCIGSRAVAQAQPRYTAAASAVAAPGSLRLARSQGSLRSSSSALFRSTPSLAAAVASPATQPSPARQPLQVASKAGYKLKTHKASAKRFRVTGSGKVVRRCAWRAHLLAKKSTKRKNRLAGLKVLFRGDLDNVIGAMPYLKVRRVRHLGPVRKEAEAVAEEGATE